MSVNSTVASTRSGSRRVPGAGEELLDLVERTRRRRRRRECGRTPGSSTNRAPGCARPGSARSRRGTSSSSRWRTRVGTRIAGQEVPDVGLGEHLEQRCAPSTGLAAERSKMPRHDSRSRSLSALGREDLERAPLAPVLARSAHSRCTRRPSRWPPGRRRGPGFRSRRCRRGSARACAPDRWPRTGRSSARPRRARTARPARSRRRPSPRARRPCAPRACAGAATGSDSPVPRLSNRISRENDASRSRNARDPRVLPLQLQVRDEARHEHEVDRPVADDLVGDVDVAALRVAGLRRHRHMHDIRSGRSGDGGNRTRVRDRVKGSFYKLSRRLNLVFRRPRRRARPEGQPS